MTWLREHGLISNYEDYLGLPGPVLEHARLLMEAEAARTRREAQETDRAKRR